MKTPFWTKTTAGMLTAVTILSIAAAPMSARAEETSSSSGDNKLNFTKKLHFAEGVTLPDLDFTFTFKPLRSTMLEVKDMPTIKNKSVKFSEADSNDYAVNKGIAGKEVTDVLEGITFTETGEYVYEVSEVSNLGFTPNNPNNATPGKFYDDVIWDSKKYELHILVKDVSGQKKLSSYHFKEIKDKTGTDTVSSDKVGAADLFNNTYYKEAGKNPNAKNNDSSLEIKKTVKGNYGDKNKDFKFTIKFILPENEKVIAAMAEQYPKGFEGKVYRENDRKKPVEGEGKKVNIKFEKVANGNTEEATFTLKDGEFLNFESLPAGVKYALTEDGTNHYKPSSSIISNLKHEPDKGPDKHYDEASIVKLPDTKIGESHDMTNGGKGYLVGEHDNAVDVTNEFNDGSITPTGLLINNLPFIVMIALGGVTFALFARRHRKG